MVIQLNTTEQYASEWLHLQVSSSSVFCYNLKSLNVSKEWGRWTAKEGTPIGAKVTGSAREMSLLLQRDQELRKPVVGLRGQPGGWSEWKGDADEHRE